MRLDVVCRHPARRTKRHPILFVHGFWHGAWCWEEHFLPYFADRGYACFAPNLRGHGGSEGADRLRWTTLADYVRDVFAAADSLDAPPILVGHSMGGLLVQKYLQERRVPAAVLLASVPPSGLLATTLRFLFRRPLTTLRAAMRLSVYPLVADVGAYRSLFLSPGVPDDEVRRFHARLQDDSFRALVDMVFLDLPDPRRAKPSPVLVLGADDFMVRAAQVRATALALGVEARIFPDMRHAMMLDVGWDRVASAISDWLQSLGL
jgi:pimeloyl-ACP methyl ester carboxylesterase